MDNNGDIKLNCEWDLWWHPPHEYNDDWTIKGYTHINTFSTLGQYLLFFNNINCIGGINFGHYFLMRKGITPIYEDEKNKFGGAWSMLTTVDDSYNTCMFLTDGLVGETLTTDMMSLTGLSINVKSEMSVIKIWNNNRMNNDVNQLPKDIPNLKSSIIYRNHKVNH